MQRHRYVVPGQGMDRAAHDAAMKRAIYYGSTGFIDPRTYTLDPWLLVRGTGMSWSAAMGYSMRAATATGLVVATFGYLGWDPMNVTPGYGHEYGDVELRPSFRHYLA